MKCPPQQYEYTPWFFVRQVIREIHWRWIVGEILIGGPLGFGISFAVIWWVET